MAISLAWECFGKGLDVKIYRMPDLIMALRRFARDQNLDEQEELLEIIKHDILIWDDFGVEKQSEWTIQTIWWLLDTWLLKEKTGLIITSNHSLKEINEKFDDRVASRIAGLCKAVRLTSSDRRIKK